MPRPEPHYPPARCPDCDEEILKQMVNATQRVVFCSSCKSLSHFTHLNYRRRSVTKVLARTPVGCVVVPTACGAMVSVSARSWGTLFFLAPFALVSMAVLGLWGIVTISGLMQNLIGPVPEWFAFNLNPRENPDSAWTTFSSGLLLILAGLFVVGLTAAMYYFLFGSVTLSLEIDEATVASGVGIFLWRERFDPHQVRRVILRNDGGYGYESANTYVEVQADRYLQFGRSLSDERTQWLAAVLAALLLPEKHKTSDPRLPNLLWLQSTNPVVASEPAMD